MRFLAMIGGAAALLTACPGAALAQEPAPVAATPVIPADDLAEIRAMVGQLTDQLRSLAEPLGIDVPDLGPVFAPLFEAALPELPDEDDSSFSIGFNFETNVTDGETLERRDDWTPVFADAQACVAAEPGLAIVHFERLQVEGGRGHHCVAAGPADDDPDVWILFATYVVETPQKRLESRTAAASAAGGEESAGTYGRAAALGEAQIPALIALSTQLGEEVTEILFAPPATDDAD